MRFALSDAVPRIIIQSLHLRVGEFESHLAKRLLQQYRHIADMAGSADDVDNVRSENNAYGIAAASGNNVSISHSVLSGNSNAGVEGDAGAQIVVDNSTITHNSIGVQSASSIRLSNNDIAFNNTAVSGSSGTFGNNRFSGNGSIGTAPTPLGGASSDLGQQ